MYKSSILITALVTGVYASENPFALEKNIQKIEQDESALLQAIVKEQKKLEKEDALSEESIPGANMSDVKTEEGNALSETEIVQEPESQKIKKEAEESKPEVIAPAVVKQKEPAVVSANETLDKVQVEEPKEVIPESVPKEAAVVAAETKKSAPSSEEKVPIDTEAETVKKAETSKPEKPLTIRDIAKKSEAETVRKPESAKAQASIEKKIEEVDAEIKKLEEKLETSKVESATGDEISVQSSVETNGSAESNTTFEQELQEAIRSVQD